MREKIVKPIHDRYEKRIVAIMEKIRQAILNGGFETSDVYDLHDDEYRWCVAVYHTEPEVETKEPPIMDVTFEILEKDQAGDAESDKDYGIAFGITVTAYGGRLLGAMTPYNYTEKLWVWGEEAVEERFAIFEGIEDWSGMVEHAETADEIPAESEEVKS